MKIRQGFVSNSSSSSFVLIVDKEVADGLIEPNSWLRAFVDQCVGKKTIFGKECYVTGTMNTRDDENYWEYREVNFDGENAPDNLQSKPDYVAEGIDMLAHLIPEEHRFSHSMDM